MSTRVELQAASIQGHNGSHEQDPDPPGPRAARSTILHLLQEASKLTAPAHSSRLDSNWSTTLSRESSSMVNKGAKDSHLFGASDSFSQHGWSQAFSYNLAKNATVAGDVHKMAAPVGPSIQRSNHWEVMSLINLQCEKLLHHRDPCETDSHSIAYSTVKSSPSGACLQPLPSESGTSSRGIASGSGILEYSPCAVFGHNSLPLAGEEEQQTESVKMTGDVTGDSRGGCREGQDSKSDSRDDSQPPQKAELVDIESSFPVQPAHRDTMEVKLSVITGLKEGSDSAEQNAPNVTRSEKVLPQMVASQASNDVLELLDQSLINSAYDYACVAAFSPLNARKPLTSEPAVALDFYSNLVLTFDPVSDTQPPPLALLSTPPQPPPLKDSKHDGVPSEQEVIHLPAEKNFPAFTQQSHRSAIKSASLSSLTTWPPGNSQVAAEQGQSHPALQQFPTKTMQRTKTPRKQSRPARSASIQHPFEGVVFRMHSELDYSRGQCRLLITSKYRRKPRVRVRSSQSSHRTSSSGEESDLPTGVSKSKACASCCTKKTPMWRDAEDGTPLCNACGIRYKKYRVRCISCWHIPRKEGNSNSCCLKCGNFVKLTAAPRKQTAC